MAFKCCRTCLLRILDVKAINCCGVLIDKCALKQKHILHPWLSGWRCKAWRVEDDQRAG